jgi:hypothetical protein
MSFLNKNEIDLRSLQGRVSGDDAWKESRGENGKDNKVKSIENDLIKNDQVVSINGHEGVEYNGNGVKLVYLLLGGDTHQDTIPFDGSQFLHSEIAIIENNSKKNISEAVSTSSTSLRHHFWKDLEISEITVWGSDCLLNGLQVKYSIKLPQNQSDFKDEGDNNDKINDEIKSANDEIKSDNDNFCNKNDNSMNDMGINNNQKNIIVLSPVFLSTHDSPKPHILVLSPIEYIQKITIKYGNLVDSVKFKIKNKKIKDIYIDSGCLYNNSNDTIIDNPRNEGVLGEGGREFSVGGSGGGVHMYLYVYVCNLCLICACIYLFILYISYLTIENLHIYICKYTYIFIYICIYKNVYKNFLVFSYSFDLPIHTEHEKSIEIPVGWRAIGFHGGIGGHLHNIGLILIEEKIGNI